MMDILNSYLVRTLLRTIAAFMLLTATEVRAEVKLPGWMTSHMVLQQGATLRIPAQTNANTTVRITASWNDKIFEATANAQGRVVIELEVPRASGPHTLTFNDGDVLTLTDIMAGEVWFCSGQSNMDMPIGAYGKVRNWEEELAAANHPMVRLFKVKQAIANEPQSKVPRGHTKGWAVCTPKMAEAFSATAYFFAREVSERLGVAVGVVSCAVGASPAESWMSRETALSVEGIEKLMTQVPDTDNNHPTVLFNGMVAPFLNMPIRGILWYQGEHNTGRTQQYENLFQALILDWQKRFTTGRASKEGKEPLPFLFVQLPNFQARQEVQPISAWASLRESQRKATKLKGTGMAVTIDIGEADDIHPKNKQDVGHRLALLALHCVYGKKDVCAAPVFKKVQMKNGRMLLTFGPQPGSEPLAGNAHIKGFIVEGSDHQWHVGKAYTLGKRRIRKVFVECPEVTQPLAVRYAWGDNPECDLTTLSGLPVGPFEAQIGK